MEGTGDCAGDIMGRNSCFHVYDKCRASSLFVMLNICKDNCHPLYIYALLHVCSARIAPLALKECDAGISFGCCSLFPSW